MQRFFLTILILICLLGLTAEVWGLEPRGKAALLLDPYSGRVLLEHNADQQLPVASISKLMTLVLILEAIEGGEAALDDLVTASPLAASKRGTRIWLEAGEQLSLKELLYAIAVGSANDAAVACGEYVAGSEELFVQRMNQRARELGLKHSHFSNCSGLPEEEGPSNAMSARDIGILARHAAALPGMMDYLSTYEYTMRPETTKIPVLWNANKLLRRYYGVDGMKTGFTTEAGYCIAASAQRDQLRLIAITLGHDDEAERESEARALLDYGFRKYQSTQLYPKGAQVTSFQCPNGRPETVPVVLPEDFYVTVERSKEVDLTTLISLEPNLAAPLPEYAAVGKITVKYGEQPVGESVLTISQAVEKAGLATLIVRLAKAMAQSVY